MLVDNLFRLVVPVMIYLVVGLDVLLWFGPPVVPVMHLVVEVVGVNDA